MAISRIDGTMLVADLQRQGVDLAFESNLLYLDVSNSRIGIGTNVPDGTLTVVGGSSRINDILFTSNTIASNTTNQDVLITPNGVGTVKIAKAAITDLEANAVPFADATASRNILSDTNLTYSTGSGLNVQNVVTIGDLEHNTNTIKVLTPGNGITLDDIGFVRVPLGTTAQRPVTGLNGMVRFNTSTSFLEFFDGTVWTSASSQFSLIVSDAFTGTGAQTIFTLTNSADTDTVFVNVNGVMQLPTTAYTVSGVTLTFTEAPANGVPIEVRSITSNFNALKQMADDDADTLIEVEQSADEDIIRFTTAGTERVKIDVNGIEVDNGYPIITNGTGTSVGTSPVVIDSFAHATYRSAKYVVQVSNGADHQVSEVVAVHDGTTAFQTEFAVVETNLSLGSVSVAINGANLELSFTGVAVGNTVKVMASYVTV